MFVSFQTAAVWQFQVQQNQVTGIAAQPLQALRQISTMLDADPVKGLAKQLADPLRIIGTRLNQHYVKYLFRHSIASLLL